jgi:hypothetical protein
VRLAEAEALLNPPPLCKIGSIISEMDDEDLVTFGRWIDESKSSTWVSNVLGKAGLACKRDTITTHWRGLCRCPEDTPYRGIVEWDG